MSAMSEMQLVLREEIEKEFARRVRCDPKILEFGEKIALGTANFNDCQMYARRLGGVLGEVFQEKIKLGYILDQSMFREIGEMIIPEMLAQNHDLVMVAGEKVQEFMDSLERIALGPKRPPLKRDRIDGIIKNIAESQSDEQLAMRLRTHTENITESFYDDFIRENADFRYMNGYDPQIIRVMDSSEKACKWCRSLAGTYDYAFVRDELTDVFKRHENCHCIVTYKNNKLRYRQDVHSKRILPKLRVDETARK